MTVEPPLTLPEKVIVPVSSVSSSISEGAVTVIVCAGTSITGSSQPSGQVVTEMLPICDEVNATVTLWPCTRYTADLSSTKVPVSSFLHEERRRAATAATTPINPAILFIYAVIF